MQGELFKNDVFKKKRSKKITQSDHHQIVTHILSTFKSGPGKGMSYPFSGTDGKAVKRLLGIYGFDDLRALWDEFLAREWDWHDRNGKRVRVPRDLRVFEAKLTELLEDGGFKKRVQAQKKPAEEKQGQGLKPVSGVVETVMGGIKKT